MSRQSDLILAMADYERGNVHRTNHFIKVLGFARTIGEGEGLSTREMEMLETAAIVHDIGIKPSMEIYGDSAGPHQETLGIPAAAEMLGRFGYDEALISRVCFLVGHHHTYEEVDGADYQILIEADFLVNLHEHAMKQAAMKKVRREIFKTATGLFLFDVMFPAE